MDGTGKATTVKLACYVAGAEIQKLNLSRTYNIADFRVDLKDAYNKSGIKDINTVFMISDSDIVKVR